MELNKNILQVPYSLIRELTEKAQKKENSIMLTIGEPDLQPPKEFIDYACEFAKTHRLGYTHSGGSEHLRGLVANHYNKYYGSDIKADNVTMHIGSMEGISSIFRTILNIDDEVIIPTPFFSPYEQAVKLSYGKCVFLDTRADHLVIKPEAIDKVITNKTKAILFSNPGNPSGYMLKKEEMDELVKYFEKKDIFIIADEIYSAISFYPFTSFASYPSIKDKVIVLNGFSKSHSMTGWRIGYSISPEYVRKCLVNASFNNVGSMVTVSCALAEFALEKYPVIESFRDIYKERAFFLAKELTDMGFDVIEPRGAFYLFVGYEKFSKEPSLDFAIRLLDETGVAVVPGIAFGSENYFRIAL
ncbi:pyridoxal phosphate-dependent aminotransferase, partial [Brachyspira hampsonii]